MEIRQKIMGNPAGLIHRNSWLQVG